MPGDESVSGPYDSDVMNTGYRYERLDNPYVKWDGTTKNYRPDQTYMRGPVEGPYTRQ